MNITISGLTAAGKTTHALLVARRLGFDYVSASELMLSRLGIENSATVWQTRMREVERRRDELPVDRELNEFLAREMQERDRTVFDSWSAGWLGDSPNCLRVFIESDLRSRTYKTRVSQEPQGPFLSLAECRRLVVAKDQAAAVRLEPLLGTDIRTDRSPFDLVLDNSALIAQPSLRSARQGIARFQGQLVEAINGRLSSLTGAHR